MRDWQDDGAPTWTTLKDCRQVAKKFHDCDLCPGRDAEGELVCGIKPGDRYQVLVGLEDGEFKIAKFCLTCPNGRP